MNHATFMPFLLPSVYNTMRCIWNLCVNFHNGSKTWADIFFKNVNLEYNKYKLRTAFDETKRP